MSAAITSSTLGVNVFTAPGKVMVGERPKPFGEPLGFDPMTSTLIFGEYDAVLVDAMTTVADAETLADWIALHDRNRDHLYNARPFRPLLRFEHSARPFPERSGESPQEMAVGEPVRRPGTCRLNPNREDLYQALAVDSRGVKQPHWAYFAPWPRSISDSGLVSFGI